MKIAQEDHSGKMMTKQEAKEYIERWRLVNERTGDERRRLSPEEKLRGLDIMYRAAVDFGWVERMRDSEEDIWWRWQKLREKLGGRTNTGE